ncbi:MAG TPA: hypothetical protein VF190_06480 [Rhodothermales bacterium]
MQPEPQIAQPASITRPAVDALTTVAIASVAISLVQILHEGTHAAACVAVGAGIREMSALHVSCHAAVVWQSKLVSASASIVNFIVGTLAFVLLRRRRGWSSEMTFFVWLFFLMNWLAAGGYWMFSGVGNVGDWAYVIDGWSPHWLWRLGMAVAGAAVYMALVWTALRVLGTIIGGADPDEQIRRAVRLGLYAYVTVFGVIFVAGMFNSYGITGLPALAALALALGGMSPLLWMMQWFRSKGFVKTPGEPLSIRRRWAWVIAGVAAVLVYVVLLGPTIHFGA